MTAAQFAANDLQRNDEDDLFDMVLTGSVANDRKLPSTQTKTEDKTRIEKPKGVYVGKFPWNLSTPAPTKFPWNFPTPAPTVTGQLGVYVGKFPWWISEEDLSFLLNKLGVQDVITIKFAENKLNGLSKGFAEVLVSSEESLKLLLEKLPKCKLGGEILTCHYASQENLSFFEDLSKQTGPGFIPRQECSNLNDTGSSFLSKNPFESATPPQFFNNFTNPLPAATIPVVSRRPPPTTFMPPPPPMFLNFMNSASNPPTQETVVAGPSQDSHSSYSHKDEKAKDHEDLLNRNRAVASAAINKAVSAATTGDIRDAMETLLTAISILKQSRVSGDDRCQALVTSLKDCLMSIQGSCSYSRHSEERDQERRSLSSERRYSSRDSRDRHHSRERNGRRSRERSREWDRDREPRRNWDRDREPRNWDRDGQHNRLWDSDRNYNRHWDRDREPDRPWDRDREPNMYWDRDRDFERNRNWDRERESNRNRDRDPNRNRETKRDWDRHRDRSKYALALKVEKEHVD